MAPKAVLAAFVAGLLFAVVTPGGAPAGAQAPDPRIADLVGSVDTSTREKQWISS